MAARYRDADILVHTSLGETFGFVYFEAADAALPVVSLDHRVARAFIPALVPGTLSGDRANRSRREATGAQRGAADQGHPAGGAGQARGRSRSAADQGDVA